MQQDSITRRSAGPRVTLTDSAAAKVAALIETEGNPSLMLRLGVRPGGCSGFSSEMAFDTEISDDDIVGGFGAEIDYQDGLEGAGFAISNPNVAGSCGCGNSFF